MQGKYKKLIEDSANAQADWWLAQLYDNIGRMLDGEDIDDDDFNAVHSAVMQRTIELLTN
jgi:hypothetical protein